MKVISVISKEVVASEVVTLNLCDNEQGSTVVGEVYIDLSEDNAVSIEASVDGKEWHDQSVVNMATFATAESITEAGYYLIPAAGLAKIRFTFTNAGSVVIKENY